MTLTEALQLVVTNLKLLADSLELAINNPPAELIPDEDELPIAKESKKETKQDETQTYTTADVREALINKAKNGKREEVQKMLHKFGVDNFSDVPTDKYAEIMSIVEGM